MDSEPWGVVWPWGTGDGERQTQPAVTAEEKIVGYVRASVVGLLVGVSYNSRKECQTMSHFVIQRAISRREYADIEKLDNSRDARIRLLQVSRAEPDAIFRIVRTCEGRVPSTVQILDYANSGRFV